MEIKGQLDATDWIVIANNKFFNKKPSSWPFISTLFICYKTALTYLSYTYMLASTTITVYILK